MLWFRADMNKFIASGHVMRCLSIADAAKILGEDSTFILSDDNAVGFINARGYKCIVLESAWNDLIKELPKMIDLVKEMEINKLVVDSYYATELYLKELSKFVDILFIDDMNLFSPPVKSVLCYANNYEEFEFENISDTHLLLGTKYTPLRKEFSNFHEKEINKTVRNILLLSGGTTPKKFIVKLIYELLTLEVDRVDVIIGALSRDLIHEFKQEKHESLFFHYNVSNIEDFMRKADLAISAGGTTLYELCACGTPTISYSLADNQLGSVCSFDREGIIPYAGRVTDDDICEKIIFYITKLAKDLYRRSKFSRLMKEKIDGRGAERIASFLIDDM